ncbi:hypothetical protein AEA09_18835 [Lysinibacillus contaminans]|uniref:Lipoprotein n=1 Tax=Lysinibacillus contaminans TaxID=1293441 RepID=A0ABR5JVU7_9BACI|nr:hypothetical protein [Lysinibacillus contaminans]KOS66275.1 hypothetical protein AEA09_18835 [Lysinibacillus contaminans]
MKHFFKMFSGIFIVILLSGCIGESYDYSPPTVTLSHPDDYTQDVTLAEANINWDYDKKYNKETEDIQTLSKEQVPIYLKAGQQVQYLIEDGHFEPNRINVSLLENDSEINLKLEEVESFRLINETGEYTVVFNIESSKGDAQYVGRIVIQ